MSNALPWFAAETGTYSTSAPNPHVQLSGTAVTLGAYPTRTFAAAASDVNTTFDTGDLVSVLLVKDVDNWARYSSAVWTDSAPDTIDLSAASLEAAAGTIANSDTVDVFASSPEALQRGDIDTLAELNAIVTDATLIDTTDSRLQYTADSRVFGFLPGANETTLAFNPGDYTLSLTPTGSEWSYYRNGVKTTVSGAKSVALPGDPVIPAAGTYYIYIDDDAGTLTCSPVDTPWSLEPSSTAVFVAEIEWNDALTPKYLLYDERHPSDITRGEHAYHHHSDGSKYRTGGVISGFTLDDDTNDDSIRFDITQAQIYDETLLLTAAAFTAGVDNYLIRYRDGSGGWLWAERAVPFLDSAAASIGYDDGSGTLATVSPNYHANVWLLITAGGFQIVMPQQEYATLSTALSEDFSDLALTGLPVAEFVARYRLTYERKSTYSTTGEVRLLAVTSINIGGIPAAAGEAPALHAATHASGGSDELTPAAIGAETAGAAATVQSNLDTHTGNTSIHTAVPDVMPQAEAEAGTATTQRTISADALKAGILANSSTITYSGTAPVSPVTGDQWVNAGIEYTWNGTQWVQTSFIAASNWDGDITDIDIDGGTDIGADLTDADLIIVDDGAGGTNRKSALSRVWTYITGKIAAATALALGGYVEKSNTITFSATPTFPVDGGVYAITLTGDITAISTSGTPPSASTIYVTQDATGSRACPFPAAWKWPDNTAFTPPTAASSVFELTLRTDPSGTVYASAVGMGTA